ncbi:MAG: DUF4286 family protein, partial [Chlamydiae bacterium]|nr:DUF4286 family protein [Chlamydiota bacterium]
VTVKVGLEIAEDWINWLQEEHIPDAMGTRCFESAQVFRLLEVDDTEGPTYVVQYRTTKKAEYHRYLEHFAADMRQRSYDKWGDRFIAFRSFMEELC